MWRDKGLKNLWSVVFEKERVEATEDCDINPGKYAKRTQVHKIRETNFVDLP
jgi:hypothetical protein